MQSLFDKSVDYLKSIVLISPVWEKIKIQISK